MAADSKRVVVMGVAGTGVLSAVGYIRREGSPPPTRLVAGVFISGALLAALAEFAPKLAAGFATVMFITAAFVVGTDAWQGIGASTS